MGVNGCNIVLERWGLQDHKFMFRWTSSSSSWATYDLVKKRKKKEGSEGGRNRKASL